MNTLFFERLEISLRKRGISTLNDLAEKVKISGGTIQGWKRIGSTPQPKVLARLVEVLNVPKEWLLGNSDTEPNWMAPASTPSIPSAIEGARYNAEIAIRAAEKLPDSDRSLNWMASMLSMMGTGLDDGGNPVMEKETVRILGKLYKHARGEPDEKERP